MIWVDHEDYQAILRTLNDPRPSIAFAKTMAGLYGNQDQYFGGIIVVDADATAERGFATGTRTARSCSTSSGTSWGSTTSGPRPADVLGPPPQRVPPRLRHGDLAGSGGWACRPAVWTDVGDLVRWPAMGRDVFYITTPIYYPNDLPTSGTRTTPWPPT